LVAALLNDEDSGMVQEELDKLEKMIQEKREKISKGG
jgi:hypothetical protein